MEFNEKLQQLRKKNKLTQEQLAEKLYVSRTAISKWESAKGYPNIESLKCISKLFSVSIDELLSSDELITLAECENRSSIKRIYRLISGIIDLMAISFILLPLYAKEVGNDIIYSVNLLSFTDTSNINCFIYWAIFLLIIGMGIAILIFYRLEKESWLYFTIKLSIAQSAVAICLFSAAREPYVTILLFVFFMMKIFVFWKQCQTK